MALTLLGSIVAVLAFGAWFWFGVVRWDGEDDNGPDW